MKWLDFITSRISDDPTVVWLLENAILLGIWVAFLFLLRFLADRWADKELKKYDKPTSLDDKYKDM